MKVTDRPPAVVALLALGCWVVHEATRIDLVENLQKVYKMKLSTNYRTLSLPSFKEKVGMLNFTYSDKKMFTV